MKTTISMNHELKPDSKEKFIDEEISALNINFRDEEISKHCLEEVFELDKYFYD